MILKNKSLLYVILLGTILFYLADLFAENDLYLLTDRFFVYWYAPVVMIAFAFISAGFNEKAYVRFKDRRQIVLVHLVDCEMYSFVLSSIAVIIIIISQIKGKGVLLAPSVLIDAYFRLFLGASLLCVTAMLCCYSGAIWLRNISALVSYAFLYVDVTFLSIQISALVDADVKLLYSWLFCEGSEKYIPIAVALSCLLAALLNRSLKSDWM